MSLCQVSDHLPAQFVYNRHWGQNLTCVIRMKSMAVGTGSVPSYLVFCIFYLMVHEQQINKNKKLTKKR